MSSELILHQALFGYDTGHHLLGASLQLSSDLKHVLAVATDLSGSAPATGFEATYTGFPLVGTNYYVLFCTWLAPEMPRPGCVWSHALFVELADFAELTDLSVLRGLFHRPLSKRWDVYRVPTNLQARIQAPVGLKEAMVPEAKRLLGALYMSPHRQVVVSSNEAARTEDLIFALWSQQWPRLRRNFRFSTGSFADRGRSGNSFDLQVTPRSNRGAWQRQGEYFLLDRIEESNSSEVEWMNLALDDLLAPDAGTFREFLREYGADVKEARSAFASLASAYYRVVLQSNNNWQETLRSIGEMFTDPSDAVHLKEWLISPREDRPYESELDRNLATATFLLASDSARPYEGVSLDFAALAGMLWHSAKREVLSLLAQLIRQQERTSAVGFVSAIANVVQPTELRLISEEHPELLQLLLSHRPALADHVETWQLPTHLQWRISEVLNGLSLQGKDWGEIVGAMFIAGTNVGVREAVEKAGTYAIEGAFRWLESDAVQQQLPSQTWREALAASAADRLRATELLSPGKLVLCSWFLSPGLARQLLSASREDVQKLAAEPLESIPPLLRLHGAFLLVALGLQAGGVEGLKLMANGFFPVYDALASSNYPSESWLLLSPELPSLGMWREWDRCKKLRRAIRERFSENKNLAVQTLLGFATNPEQLTLARQVFR